MATKVFEEIYDDIDSRTKASETVTFGIDGKSYEIDLNDKNLTKLREALKPFVEHARPVEVKQQASKSSDAPQIRAWAAENGVSVPDRGRIPREVRELYADATKASKSKGK